MRTDIAFKTASTFCRALLLCAVVGCNAYDPGALKNVGGTVGTGHDGGSATAGIGGNLIDSGLVPDSGYLGTGGVGGGMSGTGGGDPNACHPNPNLNDQVCPMICPEICNGQDDDCDLRIDEGATEICKLDHAKSLCTDAQCMVTECVDNFKDCDGVASTGCESPIDDVDNCGTCGKRCRVTNGMVECSNKKCVQTGCDEGWGDCDKNPADCETQTNTLKNCAGCGVLCENVPNATPSCDTGACGPGVCDMGFDDCNTLPADGCEQPLNTADNCGGCNVKCMFAGSMADCSSGACRATSCDVAAGYADCDMVAENGCESLNSAAHCGACNKICDLTLPRVTAATCANPACQITCADGWGDCDGDPQTGCETPLNSLKNCGMCKTGCSFPNAVADCSTGVCTLDHCNDGFDDCQNGPSDGCETALDTNQNCGKCGMTCVGGKTCSGGMCSSVDCSVPPHNTVDCNGTKCGNCDHTNEADCETDLASNPNNCGACGNVCAFTTMNAATTATLACTSTGCRAQCKPGYGDCNGDYRDGCETQLNTTSNCDACAKPCAIANASAKCTTFTSGHYLCEVNSCATDYADCDMNKTSCESSLSSTTHCGTCATACSLTNASAVCTGGTGAWACTIGSCNQTYFKNCNGTQSDGCEVDARSNVASCGACSNDCRTHAHVAGATCGASACNYTCASGFKDCTSTPGCETDIHTATDCGGCGVPCALANGTASCATGSCVLTGCNSGYLDCDGNSANGCEPLNSLQNCGACNVRCSLANATSTCGTRTCAISTCNTNWADCDGSALNGCERDTRVPSSGGLGPCLPDTGCVKLVYPLSNHTYYFCPMVRTWAAARAQCQQQLLGDLVRIDDQGENDFIKANIGGDSWLGATDANVEGTWRWVDNTAQFWSGMGASAGGVSVGGLYNLWNAGEPNDFAGAEDCAEMLQSGTNAGTWNDADCAGTQRFVCEIQDDLCPADPSKKDPLQCGCGNPDIDADGDGVASCNGQNDKCDNDPNKVAPGQCGCGVADTDTDRDGVADCVDACPTDPAKSASAGQCGCGSADTDTDADGTADCHDACKYDGTHTALPCGLAFTPSNVTPSGLFTGAPDVNASCGGTLTFSTDSAAAITLCGTSITPIVQAQSGGPSVWILPMNRFTQASGTNLRFTGTRPAVLAVANDASVSGTIDVGAQGATPGAGGNVSCAAGTGQGADGAHNGSSNKGDGGGGGGGFGTVGAAGGNGNSGGGGGAAGGAVASTLVPLRGGCRGGAVASGGNVNGAGAGGGAIQILVGGKLTMSATAIVAAAGGGGAKGGAQEDGGGGAGSGGAVFIEALQLAIDPAAWISANGGGGAGGNGANNTAATAGADGIKNSTAPASGGNGGASFNSSGGKGGQGGALAGAATAGSNGSCMFMCGDGGGGGGGGAGRVRIHGVQAGCSVPTATISPAATIACP